MISLKKKIQATFLHLKNIFLNISIKINKKIKMLVWRQSCKKTNCGHKPLSLENQIIWKITLTKIVSLRTSNGVNIPHRNVQEVTYKLSQIHSARRSVLRQHCHWVLWKVCRSSAITADESDLLYKYDKYEYSSEYSSVKWNDLCCHCHE